MVYVLLSERLLAVAQVRAEPGDHLCCREWKARPRTSVRQAEWAGWLQGTALNPELLQQ